jgi:phenylalanyl-tRNA synthetase beta chain
MRVPIAWLREYVELPQDTQAIADRLAMLGFPVEDIERRPAITGVVIGRIVELEKHPNADRLQVARIDVANEKPLTVATAATNVAAGQTIAVAKIGARLPQLTIEPRKMRGVASEGMMISAEELALPGDWFEDGIMQFEPDATLGSDVVERYKLGDDVLEVEVTSNRVDAMSIVGLARELAASYGVKLILPSFVNPATNAEPPGEAPRVEIESPDCTRFVAQRFDGLRVGPAPAWMRVRLALAGQRPINNLVDVSNYVMLETGQPLHFYDAASISDGKLIVRDAREGENVVTLDGVERMLTTQSLVIADDRRTLCLAGLMGAVAGEVTDATTAIVLEAANFNGARVRRMSKALGLRSEASSRHEKSLAPALTDAGAARAATLLTLLGATAYRPHAFGAPLAPATPISLKIHDVERLLGMQIPVDRIERHLVALGCEVARVGAVLEVTPPVWRRDLTIAADLVEEVARMEGYENVPCVVPSVPSHEISSAEFDLENRIAHELSALGYNEVVTHSLRGDGTAKNVEVLNPLSEDQRFLRDSLVPGAIEYFARFDTPIRAFEVGHIFNRDNDGVAEACVTSFGFTAEATSDPVWHDSHFLRLKGDAEALLRAVTGRVPSLESATKEGFHPGKTAAIVVGDREVGYLGALDPRVTRAGDLRLPAYLCTISLESLPQPQSPHYRVPSKFPSTYRDLSLNVKLDVTAAQIEATIAETLGGACTGVRVFDEYRGSQVPEGEKSLTVRVTMQRFDATITDEEADEAIARVLGALRDRLGAAIRQ